MTSLVPDALDFLAREVSRYDVDSETALCSMKERSIFYRDQARFKLKNEDFTESEFVQIDIEKQVDDSSPKVAESTNSFFQGFSVAPPPVPNLPGVDPDVLRNLLMSWFYAGYYSAKCEDKNS